jgi:uncharacterized protein
MEIKNLVESACKRKTNSAGYGAWTHHIVPVIKYGKILAKKLGANEEIVEIAAILHDYASVLNEKWDPKHHLKGAELAEKVLPRYHFPRKKIEKIKSCIISHRASQNIIPKTVEARIIATADSMAHFDNVDSLLLLAYFKHKKGIDEGIKWVLAKLNRSWQKLTPEAKQLLKEKYKAIKATFS